MQAVSVELWRFSNSLPLPEQLPPADAAGSFASDSLRARWVLTEQRLSAQRYRALIKARPRPVPSVGPSTRKEPHLVKALFADSEHTLRVLDLSSASAFSLPTLPAAPAAVAGADTAVKPSAIPFSPLPALFSDMTPDPDMSDFDITKHARLSELSRAAAQVTAYATPICNPAPPTVRAVCVGGARRFMGSDDEKEG